MVGDNRVTEEVEWRRRGGRMNRIGGWMGGRVEKWGDGEIDGEEGKKGGWGGVKMDGGKGE